MTSSQPSASTSAMERLWLPLHGRARGQPDRVGHTNCRISRTAGAAQGEGHLGDAGTAHVQPQADRPAPGRTPSPIRDYVPSGGRFRMYYSGTYWVYACPSPTSAHAASDHDRVCSWVASAAGASPRGDRSRPTFRDSSASNTVRSSRSPASSVDQSRALAVVVGRRDRVQPRAGTRRNGEVVRVVEHDRGPTGRSSGAAYSHVASSDRLSIGRAVPATSPPPSRAAPAITAADTPTATATARRKRPSGGWARTHPAQYQITNAGNDALRLLKHLHTHGTDHAFGLRGQTLRQIIVQNYLPHSVAGRTHCWTTFGGLFVAQARGERLDGPARTWECWRGPQGRRQRRETGSRCSWIPAVGYRPSLLTRSKGPLAAAVLAWCFAVVALVARAVLAAALGAVTFARLRGTSRHGQNR